MKMSVSRLLAIQVTDFQMAGEPEQDEVNVPKIAIIFHQKNLHLT